MIIQKKSAIVKHIKDNGVTFDPFEIEFSSKLFGDKAKQTVQILDHRTKSHPSADGIKHIFEMRNGQDFDVWEHEIVK